MVSAPHIFASLRLRSVHPRVRAVKPYNRFQRRKDLYILYLFSDVHVRYMLSPVRLSVVCNARAPHSAG